MRCAAKAAPPPDALLGEVFEVTDRKWRGIGTIPQSGYRLTPAYAEFDAERRFSVERIAVAESQVCISGLILQGLKKPHQCPAFGKACTPLTTRWAPRWFRPKARDAAYLQTTAAFATGSAAAANAAAADLAAPNAASSECCGNGLPGVRSSPGCPARSPQPCLTPSTSIATPATMPLVDYEHVLLGHGSGGTLTGQLIERLFLPGLGYDTPPPLEDQATLQLATHNPAMA